jgi:hypothetical protein
MEVVHKIENLLEHVKDYAETKVKLVELEMQDKVAETVSSLVSAIIIGMLSLLVVLFVSLGAAWQLGQYFKNTSIGFYIVAGFYLLVGIVIYAFRNQLLKTPMANFLIQKFNTNEKK